MSERSFRRILSAQVLMLALGMGALLGCGESGSGTTKGVAQGEVTTACIEHEPLRRAYFGDLHVHTRHSLDANAWDVRSGPGEAYRFARGETLELPPYDQEGRATRTARLARPLDFASVTDHAEFFGEVSLCLRPDSPAYELDLCQRYRGETGLDPLRRLIAMLGFSLGDGEFPVRNERLCGLDRALCVEEAAGVWAAIRDAAERWNSSGPECDFTTFHGYEYTPTTGGSSVHRNVIFRNANVPRIPITWQEAPRAIDLFRLLDERCRQAGTGCDVVTIPHNSNLSNGRVFSIEYRGEPLEEQRARARLQSDIEPIVEIMQIKGDSECRDGMYQVLGAPDELCAFEKYGGRGGTDCEEGVGSGGLGGGGCQSRLDFVRYALVEGLREAERIGVNPHKLGIVASTDAHNANPGQVEEWDYLGWAGETDASPEIRLGISEGVGFGASPRPNPGGLVGVWAEENSRDALFDAMERRETFGTSGPRITARFFGGWGFGDDLCEQSDLVARGYESGVPMGSDLPLAPPALRDDPVPVFVVSALRDPGTDAHPGGLLQRIQIIKGWADHEGRFHQAVYDIAGSAHNGAEVDLVTCTPRGPGHAFLCGVWRDPDFDLGRHAVYYARVMENPSCRWSQFQCNALDGELPPACTDPVFARTIQERLWTSPIWYVPAPE